LNLQSAKFTRNQNEKRQKEKGYYEKKNFYSFGHDTYIFFLIMGSVNAAQNPNDVQAESTPAGQNGALEIQAKSTTANSITLNGDVFNLLN